MRCQICGVSIAKEIEGKRICEFHATHMKKPRKVKNEPEGA